MGMFSQKEILLMIGVVSILLIFITILTILDIREYLKVKKGLVKEELDEEFEEQEDKELEPVMVMETEEETPNALINEEEVVEPKEELYLEEMEDEHFEVKHEINPILEEDEEVYIPKVDIKKKKIEVEVPKVEEAKIEIEVPEVEIKREKKRLDAFEELEEIENNLPNKKDDVTNFEAEQERTAIISLDELMAKSNELYNENEIDQYDDGDEPISIDEVIKMFKKDDEPSKVVEVKEEPEIKEMPKVYQETLDERVPYSKKETIPFISSVYGIEKDENSLEFENTATYEKLDRQNYNNFVEKLREMEENK